MAEGTQWGPVGVSGAGYSEGGGLRSLLLAPVDAVPPRCCRRSLMLNRPKFPFPPLREMISLGSIFAVPNLPPGFFHQRRIPSDPTSNSTFRGTTMSIMLNTSGVGVRTARTMLMTREAHRRALPSDRLKSRKARLKRLSNLDTPGISCHGS
jgi:hypothetical protein